MSYEMLLAKLGDYGIWEVDYNLFTIIFITKKRIVSNNQSKSDQKFIHCGVPQGLSLGPFCCFLININNLNFALKTHSRLFDDDTGLIVNG